MLVSKCGFLSPMSYYCIGLTWIEISSKQIYLYKHIYFCLLLKINSSKTSFHSYLKKIGSDVQLSTYKLWINVTQNWIKILKRFNKYQHNINICIIAKIGWKNEIAVDWTLNHDYLCSAQPKCIILKAADSAFLD